MVSPDTIIPDPTNPQSYNRYSYVRNNPVNLADPTGHRECGAHDNCSGEALPPLPPPPLLPPGFSASSCAECGWVSSIGDMGYAYDTFVGLENELGRPLTYEEILAITIYHEYGWLRGDLTEEQYQKGVETTGRLLYNFCGADGICVGDQLWEFLGNHQGFFNKHRPESIRAVASLLTTSGGYPDYVWEAARQILEQPPFDPETATDADKMSNWRSGYADGLPVPFVYGNYSLFNEATRKALEVAPIGIAVNALLVNVPNINTPFRK